MDSDGGSVNRRIYGRGLFDGLRMAGVDNPREFMNASKVEVAEKGLSGIARKVYEVVPVQESWKSHQVVQELSRLGSKPDFAVVEGCLASLKEKGLVKETQRGFWQKVKPKEEKAAPAIKLVQDRSPIPDPYIHQTKDVDDLARMASIGKQLRDLAKQIEMVASVVDSVAISVEERIQKSSDEASKLRQLQQLLKSIGG